MRFSRLGSSNVVIQVHATEDSRFALLPVLDGAAITGWRVYDVEHGRLVVPPQHDEPFEFLGQARQFVLDTYYTRAEAG